MTNLRRSYHIPITCTVFGDKFAIYGNQGSTNQDEKNTTDHTCLWYWVLRKMCMCMVVLLRSLQLRPYMVLNHAKANYWLLGHAKVVEYAPRQQANSRIVPRPCQHTRKWVWGCTSKWSHTLPLPLNILLAFTEYAMPSLLHSTPKRGRWSVVDQLPLSLYPNHFRHLKDKQEVLGCLIQCRIDHVLYGSTITDSFPQSLQAVYVDGPCRYKNI